jgi:hypothetical protein
MAKQRYFVRKRGKISGPFSVAQLRTLHARGRIKPSIEVSVDQVNWQPASSIPKLLPVSAPTPEPAADSPGETPAHEPAHPDWWYYLDREGIQRGPASLQEMQRMLDVGQVNGATFACKGGMDRWVELASMPELRLPRTTQAETEGQDEKKRSGAIAVLIAAIAVPLIGLGILAWLASLAVADFRQGNQAWIASAIVGVVVLLLVAIGAGHLGVVYQRQRTLARQAQEKDAPPPSTKPPD